MFELILMTLTALVAYGGVHRALANYLSTLEVSE